MAWTTTLLIHAALCAAPVQDTAPTGGDTPTQEAPPASLQDLLRVIEAAAGSPVNAPGLLGGGPAAAPAAPAIRVLATRDVVEVAQGGGVHPLPWWSRDAVLEPGDEVRSGTSGQVLVTYPDGTLLQLIGEAVARPWTAAAEDPRRIELRHLARTLIATLGSVPTLLELPGGHALVGAEARLSLERLDDGHLELRNSGPGTLFLRGAWWGEDLQELGAGEKILLPVLPMLARSPFLPARLVRVPGGPGGRAPLEVGVEDGVECRTDGDAITLEAAGPAPGAARAAGARLVLPPGRSLLLRRAPLGRRPPLER